MKKLLLVSLFLLSFGAFAQGELPFGAAQELCMQRTFDSDKSACLKIVDSGYISDKAALVCAGLSFDSNQNKCLKTVLNKEYAGAEAIRCLSESFDDNKIECLALRGVPANGPVRTGNGSSEAEMKLQRIERLARAVKRDLMNGRVGDALSKVIRIIDIAEDERY